MGQKTELAKKLYLKGIGDGQIEIIHECTGDRYTQHSTVVKDGVEGFIEFFQGFLKRNPNREIQVVRAIEDGNYVFLHVFQNLNHGAAKWVTTDLFDTNAHDHKIVEHWDVIDYYKEPEETVSGNDMVLGNFEIKDEDKTEENKALVRRFLVNVFQNKYHDKVGEYISTEKYIQHNPNVANGIDAVKQFLATQDFNYDFIFKIIGQGDHVVSYSKVIYNNAELAVFDIFRIENGKIVEHWDNMEKIPPRNEWVNMGKF